MVNATALINPVKPTDILFRIEFLVVFSTLLFLGMFIVDIFRAYFHGPIVKAFLGIIDNVSDSIVVYVIGAMQTAQIKNQLFPVWAIVLVGFRHSMDFISGYGIRDQDGRRFTEWRNVMKLLGVAFLNMTRGSMFAYPLWSLWGLQVVRSYYRLSTRNWAFNSVWHGKSSELVSEYMRTDTHHQNFKSDECKAETMEGYRYLVYGETKPHIILKKPRYVLQIDTNPRATRNEARAKARDKARAARVARAKARGRPQSQIQNSTTPVVRKARPIPESLITLDKIWRCDGALLHTDSTEATRFKDLSLAFSLSRLIRCRLEDVALHKDSIHITRNLVKLRIIQEEANRAFGVMELEMGFLNDYLNTRYPMVFCCGLPSLHLSLIMSIATIVVAGWLSLDIRRVYKTPNGEVSHVINSVNVDVIITWVFLFCMMFKEIWEMVSYLLSDWTRLLLACTYVRWAGRCVRNGRVENTYVRWAGRCVRNGRVENFISSFLRSKIADSRWHGALDQHVFLQSYNDSPTVGNLFHIISTGALPKKEEGATLSDHISIPECVKPAILGALRSLDITRDHLLDVIPSLLAEPRERYRWACFEMPTSTHIILVWHIATSLCEIRFAKDRGIDLSNPGFLLSALSYVTNCCNCSAQPYLVNVEDILDGDLKNRYTVANSLSRYCAYLVVSKPDLLPDRFLVPKMIFQETVQHARRILKDADSLDKVYETLMATADMADQDNSDSSTETRNVVQQGAKLAKQLMEKEIPEPERWEILAAVWADLLVHIAPSWNAGAHKKYFESAGGEFITLIWALLWHCGIEKSKLWPVEGMPENNAPGAPDNNNAEKDNVQPAQGMRQAADARERNGEQGVLAEAKTDGRQRSGLVNGHKNVIIGMRNLGNTCYFNAVLQGLLALVQLRAKMLEQDPPAGSLHSELKKLFQLTNGANCAGAARVTENLFSVVSSLNKDFKLGVMEDSNSMLLSVLNGLNNEEPTMIESLFHGLVAEHVSSKQCEHTSVKLTTQVLDLSLAIPRKKDVSIEDCLDLYATGKVEKWYCTACSAAARNASSNKQEIAVDEDQTEQSDSARHQNKQSRNLIEKKTSTQTKDKGKLPMLDCDTHQNQMERKSNEKEEEIFRAANVQYRIRKAPPILTIQLKRFCYVGPGRSEKLEEHVNFQEMLDITKLMDDRSASNEECKYSLAAVIVHDGPTLSEGHYFSYVRASSIRQQDYVSRSWFCASDEIVKEVPLAEVLKCQAYILFYERVEQSKVKTNPETDSPTNGCGEREIEMAIPAAAAELQATMEEPLKAGVRAVAEKEAEPAKEDKNKRPATAAHPPAAKAIEAPEERAGSSAVAVTSPSTESTAHICQPTSENSSPRSRAPSISAPAAPQLPSPRTEGFQDLD